MKLEKRYTLIFLIIVILFFVSLMYRNSKNKTQSMEVHFLSVGQGDATLVRTPNNLKYLIDVSKGPEILEALSSEFGFFEKNIDGVFLTHMDRDHAAGLVPLLEYYNVENIFISTIFDEESVYKELIDFIEEKQIEIVIHKIDGTQVVVLDKGVTLDILFPVKDYPIKDRNDRSLIMSLIFGEVKFLFTGDASTDIENYLIQEAGSSLKTTVLQVGHHGSRTSSSEGFLKTSRPQHAIISAGRKNDFGHPHKEVVDRLQSLGVIVHETIEGNVSFVSDGRSVVDL